MNAPALRARSVGEILDLAFQLYRSRWPQMAAATGVLVLPIVVLQTFVPLESLPMVEQLSNIFYLAASAAVVVIASEAYMGREIAAMEAVNTMGRRFLSVWGAAIMQGILFVLGLILLVVPGILVLVWTFATQQAVMIEGKRAGEALGRSRSLARGQFVHVLLTTGIALVIVFFAIMGFGLVLALASSSERVLAVGVNLGMIAIQPLFAVVGTVLYYDLRIRKEAFDVSVAADRLAEEEPLVPVPAL